MKCRDYVNQLRGLTNTGSDYAVARLLGVSEQAINRYRKARGFMSVPVAIRTAQLLKAPLAQVIEDLAKEKAAAQKARARKRQQELSL